MAARLAFIHTVASLIPRFTDLTHQYLPNVDVFHVLDESLLIDLMRGGANPSINSRIVRHSQLAQDAGATLIAFTCSSTSPAIDVARKVVDVPIVKIDDPMAAQAVAQGRKIGVLCTTSSTLQPSCQLLKKHAEAANRQVEIQAELVSGAFEALQAGNKMVHDHLVKAAAVNLGRICDVVVLAQASLAHLHDELQDTLESPVFASPILLMKELARRLKMGAKQ